MKKCERCFVRYCTAECLKRDWKNHKPFCNCMVDYLAMSGVFLADKGSRKAKKHRERMRSFVGSSTGAGYQFMDEATYRQRLRTLVTLNALLEATPITHMYSDWGDGTPNWVEFRNESF